MKNNGTTIKSLIKYAIYLCVILAYISLNIKFGGLRNIIKKDNEYSTIYKSVVIDAGSTGTRIHIYNYKIINDKGEIKIFIPSINYKASPGLVFILNNYFDGNKQGFYDYFKEIKNFVNDHVEKEKRLNTVIIFRASGGFRLLSITKSEKYINFLKDYLYKNFNEFLLIDKLLIKVLNGKEEAILSFVSIYSLLENSTYNSLIFTNKEENSKNSNLNKENAQGEKNSSTMSNAIEKNKKYNSSSIGVIEVGGASAQIVIKIPLSKMNDDILNFFNYKTKDNKNKTIFKEYYKNRNIVKIRLFQEDIFLYCKSYLVLGRQNAMKTYFHYVVHKNLKTDKLKKFIPISCFPKNFKFYINNMYKSSIEEALEEYDESKELHKDEFVGVGTGDINQCKKEIQTILGYSHIGGLPFKLKKFINLYGIENFHHFVVDILNITESYNPIYIDTNMYLEKAKQLCHLTVAEIQNKINPYSNIEKSQTSCFGLIFLHEFLRYNFKIDSAISFYSTNYINNIVITWTIAVLYMEIPHYHELIKNPPQKNYKYDGL